MNERDNFIVEDLDDFHIIIKADEEYRVRKQLELEVRRCPHHISQDTALTFLSVGEEHVQFGMIHILPNSMIKDVYALVQTRPHVHIPLQFPCRPRREFESRQSPPERSNYLFNPVPES